jgi:hypothetical protein
VAEPAGVATRVAQKFLASRRWQDFRRVVFQPLKE